MKSILIQLTSQGMQVAIDGMTSAEANLYLDLAKAQILERVRAPVVQPATEQEKGILLNGAK